MDVQTTRKQLFANQLKVLKRNFSATDTASFLPIYLQALMVGEKISFNLYLKVSTNEQEGITFLPFLEAEEVLETSWVEILERLGIDRFYFRRRDLELALAYLNNHLLLFDLQRGNPSKEKFLVIVEHLNFSLYRAFNSPQMGSHINLAKNQVERLVQMLQRDIQSLKLVWELLYRNYSLYNHSLNVCLLGIALMLFMHNSRQESLILGVACLFHDIGLTRVPEDLLYQSEPLEEDDWETMKKHPLVGYQMLKECDVLPSEVLQLVQEHHENADGSGYPQGLPLSKQHPWTRIVRLVDEFDSLTGHRPGKKSIAPFAALKSLQKQAGMPVQNFDLRTMNNFIRFLAIP
ncbi:MAG: HD domain-containing protein [Syntrophales bacterium]|nr:HD domain-containing protein [Syntrophales bacterium]